MRTSARGYPVRPDQIHLLLLKAALSEGDQARVAWQEARQRIGSIARLEGGSYRLLPLLYRNLSEQGVEDPELERLKGVYRHCWYTNHMLFHEAGVLLGSLERAGVDTLVLKGGALSRLYYPVPGTRPMEDVDVLVHRRQAREAIEVLERDGWKLEAPAPIECVLRTRKSSACSHPRGRFLDLHWSPLWQPTDEQSFWDHAIPLEIGGAQTRALCPEDQLLHVCVHGMNANMRRPYWAADAVMISRSQEGKLDWQRLVELARDNELSLALEHGLRFLGDEFELDIPRTVLAQLGATTRSRSERLTHRIAFGPPDGGVFTSRADRLVRAVMRVLRDWDRYRRVAVREGGRASLAGFATYEQQFWGAANRRQLLGILVAKGGQILRHRAWDPKARSWRGAPLPRRRGEGAVGSAGPTVAPHVTILPSDGPPRDHSPERLGDQERNTAEL